MLSLFFFFTESDPLLETVESDLKCDGLHHYASHPDYITIYPDNGKCPPKGKLIINVFHVQILYSILAK